MHPTPGTGKKVPCSDNALVHVELVIACNLKLQSVTFTSLLPSMFENLELQILAELSSVHGVVIRCSGTAPARIRCGRYDQNLISRYD